MNSASFVATVLAAVAVCPAMAQDAASDLNVFHSRMQCTAPEYPVAAARAGAQGATHLTVVVGEDSKVIHVEITKSAGASREHLLLDRIAQDAVMTCHRRGDLSLPPGRYKVQTEFTLSSATPG